jgi:bifunctional ADP-heptose synthase (sugar kinase/adenylyltransferase)
VRDHDVVILFDYGDGRVAYTEKMSAAARAEGTPILTGPEASTIASTRRNTAYAKPYRVPGSGGSWTSEEEFAEKGRRAATRAGLGPAAGNAHRGEYVAVPQWRGDPRADCGSRDV